jgi:diacylglycerol kinase (ATP)
MGQVKEKEQVVTNTQPLSEAAIPSGEQTHDNFPPGTRIMVIVNPASGKKAGIITTNSAGIDDVRKVLEANSIEADVVETEHPGHATELARQAAKDGYDFVVACGGDGTVGEAAKGLIGNKKTTLGILPLGSANNVARMMNVPFELEEAGKLLRSGTIMKADVGRCNGTYFLETAGIGLDAALFPILNKVDKGQFLHLWDAAKTLFAFRPRSVSLVLDNRVYRMKALVVLVANGPYWGYSVPLAPDAQVDDHKFDVVVFHNFSKTDFIRHLISALLHRDFQPELNPYHHHPKLRTFTARRVQVSVSDRKPWPVHADALPRGKTPALIEVVPGALRVIAGEKPEPAKS